MKKIHKSGNKIGDKLMTGNKNEGMTEGINK